MQMAKLGKNIDFYRGQYRARVTLHRLDRMRRRRGNVFYSTSSISAPIAVGFSYDLWCVCLSTLIFLSCLILSLLRSILAAMVLDWLIASLDEKGIR